MTDEQWQAAWRLFQSGSSVPPDQIQSFRKNATGDLLVRDAVIAMLDRTKAVETLDRVGQRTGRYGFGLPDESIHRRPMSRSPMGSAVSRRAFNLIEQRFDPFCAG